MSDTEPTVRRRGRRPKVDPEVQTAENAEAHVALKQQRDYLKLKGDVKEDWFVFQNNKLLQKKRYGNGNVYTTYVDSYKPNTRSPKRKAQNERVMALVKKYQKEGKLRAV